MRVSAIFIAALLAAVLVAGCGGSSGSGSSSSGKETSGSPLTKAAFIKKGDTICSKVPIRYHKTLEALEKEAKKGTKLTKSEETVKAAVPPLYEVAEELKKLSPPKGEEQTVEAIIVSLEKGAKGLEEKPESELQGPKSPLAEFQKLAGSYGFEFCSSL